MHNHAISSAFVGLALGLLLGCNQGGDKESEPETETAEAEAHEATGGDEEMANAEAEESGTTDEQTFAEAMKVLCEAPNEVNIENVAPPDKAVKLARHIEENLSNEEARTMFETLASMSNEERLQHVDEAAEKAGLEKCPILGVWERPAR